MLARNLSAAPASLLWSKSDQLKIYIRFYHTGLSREKINEGYLLCSCNLWKYWFSFYSEFGASVCNHSLADYTVLVTVSLTHGERERLQTSRVRLEICYLHTAPPVKVLNQASPQHLSANKTLLLHSYIDVRFQNIIYCFIAVLVCSFATCFVFNLIIFNLDCSFEHIAAHLDSLFDIQMS